MDDRSLRSLLVALIGKRDRRDTARTLAERLGAHDLLVFVRDPELEVLLPARAFPPTLPEGRRWHAFLADCLEHGSARAVLPNPNTRLAEPVTGFRVDPEAVLALLGPSEAATCAEDLLVLMPLVTALFRAEREATVAESRAARAREAAGEAAALAASLERMRRELEKALAETRAARAEADAASRAKARLEHENVYLQEEIRREHAFEEMVGSSPALLEVLGKVEQVASTDTTVLVLGETGTGKELIARAIHTCSFRRDRPLVKVNCAAVAAGLVESELFGHVKGAFTGALERRVGRFELADGGTLFLDEVSELPPETQVKLLRVLQEQEFEPVGSSRTIRVDVRIIAASNRNLDEAVRAGRFRADLFYRLNVFLLRVPPLRERRSDIPKLVMFLLARFSKKFGKKIETVSQDTMDLLMSYEWPGNVRELQNVVERAMVLARGSVLVLDRDLLPALAPIGRPEVFRGTDGPAIRTAREGEAGREPAGPGPSELRSLEEMERHHILTVLKQTRGVIDGPNGAAGILHLHPNTLRSRMKKLGITRFGHEMS